MEPNPALELYKLEYERCAIRYEDIYKAVWTNFSYLSVVAGAVLTFGSTYLNTNLAAFIACFPLLFWYWATFLPLDGYADDTLFRLKEIERTLNEGHGTKLDHYTKFWKSKIKNSASNVAQSHVQLRARYAIKAFFFLLHIIAVLLSQKLYGLLVSSILGVIIYCFYIWTHFALPRWDLKHVSKSALLLIGGAGVLFLLITTPMPKRAKETKKIVVTNKDGTIDVKSERDEGEAFVIQLVGFDGVDLK